MSSKQRPARQTNGSPNAGKRHLTARPVRTAADIAAGKGKHPRASRVTVTQVSPQTLRRRFNATGKYGKDLA